MSELQAKLPTDTWVVATWDEYIQAIEVTAERSIATDKSLMPPGALALIHTDLPFVNPIGQIEYRTVSRYVLDQDTGSAIKGPGRVDYFMGTGKLAGDRALRYRQSWTTILLAVEKIRLSGISSAPKPEAIPTKLTAAGFTHAIAFPVTQSTGA